MKAASYLLSDCKKRQNDSKIEHTAVHTLSDIRDQLIESRKKSTTAVFKLTRSLCSKICKPIFYTYSLSRAKNEIVSQINIVVNPNEEAY